MARDPYNPFDDKAVGRATLGAVLFCAMTGLGVGAFVQEPVAGGLAGGVLGIVTGLFVVPRLMYDWRDS